MTKETELKVGDRVINSIDEPGTIVEPTSDQFGFVSKSGMVEVHFDMMPDGENFLCHPENLRKI